jgi:hypothetical protein
MALERAVYRDHISSIHHIVCLLNEDKGSPNVIFQIYFFWKHITQQNEQIINAVKKQCLNDESMSHKDKINWGENII